MRKLSVALLLFVTSVAVACSEGIPTSPETPSGVPPSASGLDARFTHIAVTTFIDSVDGGDISSDGRGAYSDNVEGVKSILTENGYNNIKYGDWQFDTVNSGTRAVGHTFEQADAVQPGDPRFIVTGNPPFWGTQILNQKNLAVKCTMLNRSMLAMTSGSSFTCPLVNAFITSNGTEYALSPAFSFTGHPETTDGRVVCNGADSAGCRDWFIEPIDQASVARLVRKTPKPNQPSINEGAFYLKYRIHVTRP